MAPPSFQRPAPGRIEVREGGGCLSIFGLPFLGVGLLAALIGFGVLPLEHYRITAGTSAAALMVIGATFTLVGGALVFGRSWIMLTSADRTIVKRVGLLVPMSTKAYRVDDYSGVLLEFVRGDSDTSDAYPVSLKARAGRNLRLFSSTQYAEARERASAVADLFNFEIEDSSTGRPVRRSAAEADMSFQNRRRLEHARDDVVARPASMRSTVAEHNGGVIVTIPAAHLHPALFLFFVIPMAAPVLLVAPFLRFFQESQTPEVVSWVFLGFLIVAFGMLPAYAGLTAFLKSRHGRTTVSVSTTGVRIDERRIWKTRTIAAYSAGDILDVDYARDRMFASGGVLQVLGAITRSGGVTITTRRGQTTFAQGLDDREVRYLHFIVRRALSPQP